MSELPTIREMTALRMFNSNLGGSNPKVRLVHKQSRALIAEGA